MVKGLKINNESSSVAKKMDDNAELETAFSEKVEKTEATNLEFTERTLVVGNRFFEILRDRTLPKNKTELSKKLELQIIKELQSLSIEINSEISNQPEGMGSTALDAILFGSVLKIRDRLNLIEFNIEQIQKTQGATSNSATESKSNDRG